MKLFCAKDCSSPTALSKVHLRPDSALTNSGKSFYLPDHFDSVWARPALVVVVGRVGKCIMPKFVHKYLGEIRSAILLTGEVPLEGREHELINTALLTESFDGSVVRGKPCEWGQTGLRYKCGEETKELSIPTPQVAEEYLMLLSRYFLLKMGDLLILPLTEDKKRCHTDCRIDITDGDHLLVATHIK